jgi:DNA-binding NtrC family response regulator
MVLERGERIGARSLVLDWAEAPPPAALPVAAPHAVAAPAESAPPAVTNELATPPGIVPLEEMEREMVARAMRAAGDNQTRAAELLGVSRDQLRYRLKKFGLRDDVDV